MDDTSLPLPYVGRSLLRREDKRLLTGQGQFLADLVLPKMLHAVLIRSPFAHARIRSVDLTRTAAAPGVVCALSGIDLLQLLPPVPEGQIALPAKWTSVIQHKFLNPQQPLLAHDKVRHVGEAVAVVVAETAAQAQDAAEAVAVEYEELPWVAATQDALMPDAPIVWDEVPDNVLVDTSFGDAGATERAFAAADHIVEMEFDIGRVTGVPIEPRAALGHWDAETGRYTLWAGSGGAVRQKAELAAVLGFPPEMVRVLSFDVGGNFGTRNRLYVESALVLWASRKLGRPVKYTSTRSEVFLSDYQGRDLLTRVALAVRADGRFLGLSADNVSNVGARCASLSPLSKGSALVTGSYDIPAARLRSRGLSIAASP